MTSNKMTVESDTSITIYEYEWKVNNFLKHYDTLRGVEFSPIKSFPLTFVLELQPRISRNDSYWGYNVNLIKLSKEEISNACRVEILVEISTGGTTSSITAMSTNCVAWTVCDIVSKRLFSSYLNPCDFCLYVNNKKINVGSYYVTFRCKFTFFGYNVSNVSTNLLPIRNRFKDVCGNFKTLYESKTNSDVSFKIGNDNLKAHQCVLVARSEVFKKMFESNLAEADSKCITITDYDIHVFDGFLKFLYWGEIDDTSFNVVMDLYSLADKYNVDDLLQECEDILANSLTAETACKVVILSDLHNDDSLKNKCLHFINHHFSAIKNREEWKEIIEVNPKLACEIYQHVVC